MAIQWFPGHMNKAKKDLLKLVKDIDVVIELLDARAPLSSCNPLLQNIIKHKKRISLLNKSDLADNEVTKLWLDYFNNKPNIMATTGSMSNKNQRSQLIKLCEKLAPNRSSYEKPLRVMITGIPNVGKSTLINQLINKKSARTGDIPAVTRANQCLTLRDDFIIYDTPGMTWEKIHNPHIGYNLALCNSIGKNALDEELLALYLIEFLEHNYPETLILRYKLINLSVYETYTELLEIIAKKRGCLLPGGKVDIQKASELIIQDFREGRLGQISLETPTLWEEWSKENEANIDENSNKFNEEI